MEAIDFVLITILILFFSYMFFVPAYLFYKKLKNGIFNSLISDGFNKGRFSRGYYYFEGYYNKYIIVLHFKREIGLSFFLRIMVTYNPKNSVRNHIEIVEKLNIKLRKKESNLNPNSRWCADGLDLAWELNYNNFSYSKLKNKIEEVIGLIEAENFNFKQSKESSEKFCNEWDEIMLS